MGRWLLQREKGKNRMRRTSWLLIGALLLFGGCKAHILENDQIQIRESLLDMYQDEVMDNLIRTKLYLPVIQVDYRTMTGTATSLTKGNASFNQEEDSSHLTLPSASVPAHALKSTSFFGAEQDLTTQLTLTGEPVCDDSVYEAYCQYLYGSQGRHGHGDESDEGTTRPATVPLAPGEKSTGGTQQIAQNPSNSVYTVVLTEPPKIPVPEEPVPQGRLLVSDSPPPDGTYHIMKFFQGKYYYIPPDSAEAFFKLYRRVVLERTHTQSGTQTLGDQLELFRLNQLQP
jgi:hypothetical protein